MDLSGLGRVWRPSPLRRVDIVAMGASCVEFAKDCYHIGPREKDHQVWTLNSGPLCFQHDLIWNMHDLTQLPEETDYIGLYKTTEKPLVTIRALEELPNSFEFPLAEWIEKYQNNYFANTVSYMIAGALMCGVEELVLYGADYNYAKKSDYEAGRSCVEYWLGYATAKGIKVKVAMSSTLLDACHRIPGNGGAIGYGEVYGYFKTQPKFDFDPDGKVRLVGFDSLAEAEIHDDAE